MNNDNEIAIKMSRDISDMLEGIEYDDADRVSSALRNLKNHTEEFKVVFNKNCLHGMYRVKAIPKEEHDTIHYIHYPVHNDVYAERISREDEYYRKVFNDMWYRKVYKYGLSFPHNR